MRILFRTHVQALMCEPIIKNYFSYKKPAKINSEKNNELIQEIMKEGIDYNQLSEEEQTRQVLKTYLEIIPPYKIQQLVEPQRIDLSKEIQLSQNRELSEKQLSDINKKLKKNIHMMKIQDLGHLLQALNQGIDIQNSEENQPKNKSLVIHKKIENRIISIARKKIHILSIEQIVNFMYKLVKLNKKDFEFMKEVQRVLIEQKIPIKYPLLRKIIWSFTHLDAGSSVLYSHISRTIKIGQHELHPLQLAESAYMLSKVTENVTGGYGVFVIAEKHLQTTLPRLDFHELVKASSLMLTQNIGSNKFQTKLQEQIYKKFPNRVSLSLNDLVVLLKSTSAYYFKYKESALLHMLKAATERMAQHATLQQFQDIIWSWGRAGKGDHAMWKILQQLLERKFMSFLKPRQLAFMYHSMSSTEYSSSDILIKLQNRFFEMLQSKEIKAHYILKFLLGMQKRHSYNSEAFLALSKNLCQRIPMLSPKQLMSFVKIINESDLHFNSKEESSDSKPELISEIERHLVKNLEESISKKIYLFKISEIAEILYMWVKLDLKQSNTRTLFTDQLFELLELELINIPKTAFIKAFFCFVIKDRIKPAFQMIPILYELMKYGPIGYFFSPYETPLLAYSLLHLQVNGEGQIQIKQKLLGDICQIMNEIDPVILNEFVKKGYEEGLKLKGKYEEKADQKS